MKVESIGLANELDWNVREELRLTASPTEARAPLQGRDCHIHFCIAYTKHSALNMWYINACLKELLQSNPNCTLRKKYFTYVYQTVKGFGFYLTKDKLSC